MKQIRKRVILLFVFFGLLFVYLIAFGQGEQVVVPKTGSPDGSGVGAESGGESLGNLGLKDAKTRLEYPGGSYRRSMLGLFVKTALVLGIIVVTIYFGLRFFFRRVGFSEEGSGLINVMGSAHLAPNKYIQLVEVGERLLILGVSDNGINLLTEINDKESIDSLKMLHGKSPSFTGVSFSKHLGGFLKRFHLFSLARTFQAREKERFSFFGEQIERIKRLGAAKD
jgi:flagellar biosynthetic protein FliO